MMDAASLRANSLLKCVISTALFSCAAGPRVDKEKACPQPQPLAAGGGGQAAHGGPAHNPAGRQWAQRRRQRWRKQRSEAAGLASWLGHTSGGGLRGADGRQERCWWLIVGGDSLCVSCWLSDNQGFVINSFSAILEGKCLLSRQGQGATHSKQKGGSCALVQASPPTHKTTVIIGATS